MKSKYLKLIIPIIVAIMLFSTCSIVFAGIGDIELTEGKYSEEYEAWLNLPEEERAKTVMPMNMFDVEYKKKDITEINNIFKMTKVLGANFVSSYDLRTVIPENMVVRNQGETSLCWAFSSLANLESVLGLKDKKANKTAVAYDFSERHIAYATTRAAFLNDVINQKGLDKNVIDPSNYVAAAAYLTNGSGAVSENLMRFEGDWNNVALSTVNNKEQETTVIDYSMLTPSENGRQEAIETIKSHIMNNGGVSAMIYGASLTNECYDNNTAALYTNDSTTYPVNHGVLIVGWDDNFDKNNFKEGMRPTSNGAWIVKNSWGTGMHGQMSQVKASLFESTPELQSAYAAAQLIPDQLIVNYFKSIYGENKVTLQNDVISIEIGDNGFIYVSYEDANILSGLYMIDKASNKKEYDNIYQNEYFGANNYLSGQGTSTSGNKVYIASVFNTKSSNEELTSVAVSTFLPMDGCKVFVNPASSSKATSNLQAVTLKEGQYENIDAGYRTIEFANPVKLTGNSFVVVIEYNMYDGNIFAVPVTKPVGLWSNFTPVSGKTFVGFASDMTNDSMVDTATLQGSECNIPMKAFTNNIVDETVSLQSIEITTPPTKTTYSVGDTFNKAGMVVKAHYTNGTSKTLTSSEYTVTNGTSLKANQTSVTISYTEGGVTKTAIQNITVNPATTPTNPSEPTQSTQPTLSNFKNSLATVTNAESYIYTNIDKTEYTLIRIRLLGINIGDDVSTRKFYFYLSNSKGETNIPSSEWTEFTVNTDKGSGTIEIDSRNLAYVNDLEDGDNLYLYVKEVATLNGESTEMISTIGVNNDANVLVYVDDVLKVETDVKTDEVKEEENNKIDVSTDVGKDTTVATKSIPQTGERIVIASIVVIAIVTIGGISYIKYKNMIK